MKISGHSLRQLLLAAAVWIPLHAQGAAIASRDILPADGTTGQTLTTGNGVKTGHIPMPIR